MLGRGVDSACRQENLEATLREMLDSPKGVVAVPTCPLHAVLGCGIY